MSETSKSKLKVVEGTTGVWHYHLSESGRNYQPALCGEREVMQTEVPLTTWGDINGNVSASYCLECDKIYQGS